MLKNEHVLQRGVIAKIKKRRFAMTRNLNWPENGREQPRGVIAKAKKQRFAMTQDCLTLKK